MERAVECHVPWLLVFYLTMCNQCLSLAGCWPVAGNAWRAGIKIKLCRTAEGIQIRIQQSPNEKSCSSLKGEFCRVWDCGPAVADKFGRWRSLLWSLLLMQKVYSLLPGSLLCLSHWKLTVVSWCCYANATLSLAGVPSQSTVELATSVCVALIITASGSTTVWERGTTGKSLALWQKHNTVSIMWLLLFPRFSCISVQSVLSHAEPLVFYPLAEWNQWWEN